MSSSDKKESFFAFENLRSLFVLGLIIFAVRWSVISPYHVPTASMEPTIKVGDRLLAWKLSYNFKIPFTDYVVAEWGQPEIGDIIVFKYPKNLSLDYVKRVIGVSGDKIKIIDDVLYVNDVPQQRLDANDERTLLDDIYDEGDKKNLYRETLGDKEHWVIQNKPGILRALGKNWPPYEDHYVVPEDSVFVMGDNRDNSTDSRIWGEVPLSYVRGEAFMVLWSMRKRNEDNSILPTIRWYRFGDILE